MRKLLVKVVILALISSFGMTSCNSEKTKEQYVEYAADSQLANAVFLPDCTNADVSSAEFLGLTVQTTDVKDNCTKNITVEQLLGGKY